MYDSLALECCILCKRPKNTVIHYDQLDIIRATESMENAVVLAIVSYCKGNFLSQKNCLEPLGLVLYCRDFLISSSGVFFVLQCFSHLFFSIWRQDSKWSWMNNKKKQKLNNERLFMNRKNLFHHLLCIYASFASIFFFYDFGSWLHSFDRFFLPARVYLLADCRMLELLNGVSYIKSKHIE